MVLAPHVQAQGGRLFLRGVVQQCLVTTGPDYCSQCQTPRADSLCAQHDVCEKSIEVWAQTDDFVALRDIKMCGCRADFVHGLALPRRPVSGVEDGRRPEGIWAFAWAQGRAKIAADELALVVNPKSERSQDQLHVHIVRLRPQARAMLAALPSRSLATLSDIWSQAQALADARSWRDYSVMVIQNADKTYRLIIDAHSLEQRMTHALCH
jgi:CDP-diacylglycerol pyrophosphatase